MTEKDFDDLIRKAASTDLTPDECFNWENMNIPTPKRKRRKLLFIFFFFGLGTLCLLGTIYYFLDSSKVQTAQRIIISNKEYDPHILDSSIVENEDISDSKIEKDNDIINQDARAISKSSSAKTNEGKIRTKSLSAGYVESALDAVPEGGLFNGVLVGAENNVIPSNSTSVKETLSFEEVEYRMFDRFYFDSPALAMNYLKPDKRLNYWFVRGGILTHENLIGGNEFTDTNFGRNSSGLLIAISKHHSLRRNWFLETGFIYSRLNHFYQGEQDLGYINDISAAERISSRRILKHNNLIEIAEIQLGLGKVIPLAENFQFISSISVLPGVVTRRAGRVFLPNESTPISIAEAANGFPFSLSTELMFALQYQVRKNLGIGIVASNKYYFTGIPVLTESQRPYVMSIGLSVRMSIGG